METKKQILLQPPVILAALLLSSCIDLAVIDTASSPQPSSSLGETSAITTTPEVVTQYVTHGDKTALFQRLSETPTFTSGSNRHPTLEINTSSRFQPMDGFGYTLTQASAYVMREHMNSSERTALLRELFDSANGIGVSFLRVGIGATDLSTSVYTYNDLTSGTDENMNQFSLAGPDLDHLIPVLKEILAIVPDMKIIATPWTAPVWMKTNGSFIGGSLNPAYYDAYAKYFVKYVQAMQSHGIAIYAITPQNEPGNPHNNPSMTMTAAEQSEFILRLGPAFQAAGIQTKIIVYDHNCDNTDFPTTVLNGPAGTYCDGAAFHLYAGNISAMTTVRNNTGKNMYFTEQYTGSNGNFSNDLGWHMQNVMIGGTNNWARIALEWNLATDPNYGPYTPGGCTTCLGAVTISAGQFTRNVSYYIVAHMAKFIRPGAVRVASTSSTANLVCAAFENNTENGSMKVMVVYNKRPASQTFNIKYNGKIVTLTLHKNSVGTYIWY